MSKNLRTETAQNSAAAPDEKKFPYGAGVETIAENHSESEVLAPVQPRVPPIRMLRMREVMARTGLSRTTAIGPKLDRVGQPTPSDRLRSNGEGRAR